ncbi:hypothetical protein EJB05_40332, partial [Eragrostis curvula]
MVHRESVNRRPQPGPQTRWTESTADLADQNDQQQESFSQSNHSGISDLSVNQDLGYNADQQMDNVLALPAIPNQDDEEHAFIPDELNENDPMELQVPFHQPQPLQQQPPLHLAQDPVIEELAENQAAGEDPNGEDDVRRSDRIKLRNKGYKGKHCSEKNCYACCADPPNLTPRDIKNLGETYCKIKPVALSEKAFGAVASKTSEVIGEKKTKPIKKKGDKEKACKSKTDSNEDKPKKNPRKQYSSAFCTSEFALASMVAIILKIFKKKAISYED